MQKSKKTGASKNRTSKANSNKSYKASQGAKRSAKRTSSNKGRSVMGAKNKSVDKSPMMTGSSTKGASAKSPSTKGTTARMGAEKTRNKTRSNFNDVKTNYLKTEEYYSGFVQRTAKGYGFLICDELDEDVFIPQNAMNGANHNDIVEVRITFRGNKGLEGEVIGIIERRLTKVVGTFRTYSSYCLVEPDDLRICKEIFVTKSDSKGAEFGQKVVVEITSFDDMRGKVVEILGMPEDKNVDILSIIRSYNLYETFPSSVEREANLVSSKVLDSELDGREDFRNDLVFTIDGDDSRDFDDAVSLTQEEETFKLSVHIADVAHYVLHSSKLDQEAYKRGTSVYFPEMVFPMLPKKLSNGICSLNENVDRLTLSIIMNIDKAGNVLKSKLCEGVIRSNYRLTYKKTAAILEGDKELLKTYKPVVPMLKSMQKLAAILTKKREKRGAVDFDLPECEVILDENGRTIDIEKKPRLVSHRIIEEFMLIANETVAHYMNGLKLPFIYRVHESPPLEKLERLNDFLQAIGVACDFSSEVPTPKQLQTLLNKIPSDLKYAVNRTTLRCMAKAAYESENRGHYGLAAVDYCHFTSPIRRYPDLVIHRIIKDYLKNGKKAVKKYEGFVVEAANVSSVRERLAEKAERDVDDLKKAEFMRDKIGQSYLGIISSVTEFGFFVELDNSIEGLVRIDSLKGYNYEFNPKALTISNTVTSFKIGQTLKVKVDSVNGSKISFVLQEDNC